MMIRRQVCPFLALLLAPSAIALAQSPAGAPNMSDAGPVPIFARRSPILAVGSQQAEIGRIVSVPENGIDLSPYEAPDYDRAGSKRHFLFGNSAQAKSETTDDAALSDEDLPAPPGGFSRSAVKIPSRFLKTQSVTAHTSPDVSFDLDKTTRIGLFGDVNKNGRGDKEAALAKPEREKAAGLTLQYKFGSY